MNFLLDPREQKTRAPFTSIFHSRIFNSLNFLACSESCKNVLQWSTFKETLSKIWHTRSTTSSYSLNTFRSRTRFAHAPIVDLQAALQIFSRTESGENFEGSATFAQMIPSGVDFKGIARGRRDVDGWCLRTAKYTRNSAANPKLNLVVACSCEIYTTEHRWKVASGITTPLSCAPVISTASDAGPKISLFLLSRFSHSLESQNANRLTCAPNAAGSFPSLIFTPTDSPHVRNS